MNKSTQVTRDAGVSIEQRVAHAALRIAYERLLLSVLFTLAVSLLFIGLLLPFFRGWGLALWVASIQLTAFARFGLWHWYWRVKPGIEQTAIWSRRFFIGALAAAAAWSIGAVALLPPAGRVEIAILCVTLLAVSSVAVSSLSVHLPSLIGFLLACLGPLAVAMIWTEATVELVVGFALLASIVALGWTGWQSTRVMLQLLRTELELGESIDATRAAQQAAEKASRAKSRFLATMSHEVRTPLNGVLGLAELLEGTSLDAGQRRHLRLLRQSGDNLREIVNDILDFSKIEAEQMELASIEFEPRQLLEQLCELWRERAGAAGLMLHGQAAAHLPLRLRGDSLRLRQILTNFLGNALKFTEKGGIELRVDVEAGDAPTVGAAAWIRFAVRDSGIGIAPEAAKHVFDAFTQVDESYSRRFGGTGLGLAICQRLVELMGGRIGVDSEPGVGSTFWIVVPLEVVQTAGAELAAGEVDRLLHEAPQDAAAPGGDQLRGRVLMVEDNAVNRVVCGAMLERLGLEFEEANDGGEALTKAVDGAFDLVLMDCQMPVLDGYGAAAELRRRGIVARRGGPLPIIALTANAFCEDRERARESGMDDFLSKPVRLDELCGTLERWLPPAPPSTGLEPQTTHAA